MAIIALFRSDLILLVIPGPPQFRRGEPGIQLSALRDVTKPGFRVRPAV